MTHVSEFSRLFCPLFRTDALLLKLSLLVGQQVFYGALWGSMLVSPLVRLPASVFIVTHFDRMVSLRQQTHMIGYDHGLMVSFRCCLIADFDQCLRGYFFVLWHILAVFFTQVRHLSEISFELFSFCLSSGEVGLSFSARFKCSGAEEHARGPALLFPICWIAGRCTHKQLLHLWKICFQVM